MAEMDDLVLEIPADEVAVAGGGELEYAGFWSRVAALIVDNAIVMILGLALLIVATFVGAGAVIIANLAYILIAILYWPLMESSERQATIGKQLLGIQVTDANGARLTFVRSLLRNLAKIISSLPFGLGFLLAAFTARKQALHDMITKCLVVRAGPSNFLKAVIAAVGALLISMGGAYYYFAEVYLPQATQDMAQQMEKAKREAQKGAPGAKPAPAQSPVAQTPTPAAQPVPEKAAPGEPKLMTPQEIAEFEKRMEQEKREPARVAVVTPPASASTPAPAQKPAAPTPVKPAAVDTRPEPAKPAAAPVVKEPAPKPAAAPAAQAKPEPKPAAAPAPKPKPAPAPATDVSAALVSEPPAPPPAPSGAQPRPTAPAVVVVAPPSRPVRSPKFNDVMTAVMYRDAAAATELLELGWWVDRADSNGVSPLMAAAWNGDVAMTQLLLKGGADPNRRGPGGSVLDYAGRSGNNQVIELLKQSGAL